FSMPVFSLCCGVPRALHSFPTRRSSDLGLAESTISVIEDYTKRIAESLGVLGLINVQFAVKRSGDDPHSAQVFVIEANPRASRRSEEHTSELQSRENLVCRLLLEKKHNI